MLSAFVFMPFLITRFGAADYGIYLLVSSLSGYFGLLDLGVGASLVKYVAEHRARGERADLSETVSTALAFYGVIGVIAATGLGALAMFGLPLFNLPDASTDLARNLLLVGAATSLFAWPLGTFNAVLAGHQRYDITARLGIIATITNIAVTAAVVLANQGPLVLLAGTSAVGLTVSVFSARLAIRELGDARVSLAGASWCRLKRIFRFSSAVFVMQLCGVLVYQQTDRLVLGVFASAASITLYESASKLHSLVRQLAGLSASAVMPTASALDAEDRHDLIVELFMRGTKYTVIAITPIVVVVMVLAGPFLRAWLGDVGFTDAEFSIMTIGTQLYVSYWLLNANITIAGTIVSGMGKLRFVLWYTVIASVANVVLSIVFVQYLGVIGVILGTIAHGYIGFPIYMRQMSRLIGFSVGEWLRRVVLPTYPFLLAPAAIAGLALALGLTNSLLSVGIVGAIAVASYWALIYLFALGDAERDEARTAVNALRRKMGLSII